jgi:hypothetical protein
VKDLELAKALEDAYLTPLPSEEDEDSPHSFCVQHPIDQDYVAERIRDRFNTQGVFGDTPKDLFSTDSNNRFKDCVVKRLPQLISRRLQDSCQKAGRKRDVRPKTNLLLHPSQYGILS